MNDLEVNPTKNPAFLTICRVLERFENLLAEREGFEPPEAFTSTVFKTAAFDRSAISPRQKYMYRTFVPKKSLDLDSKKMRIKAR